MRNIIQNNNIYLFLKALINVNALKNVLFWNCYLTVYS